MRLRNSIFFSLIVLFIGPCFAQDVISATSEDLNEFDKTLAKKKTADTNAKLDAGKQDLRRNFNAAPNLNGVPDPAGALPPPGSLPGPNVAPGGAPGTPPPPPPPPKGVPSSAL